MVQYEHGDLTGRIITAAHTAHNTPGYGFVEKVYHSAMLPELGKQGIDFESKKPLEVACEGRTVGRFTADIVVEGKVTVELKAAGTYNRLFEAQLLNYLRATGLGVGLVLNFGPSVVVKTMALTR